MILARSRYLRVNGVMTNMTVLSPGKTGRFNSSTYFMLTAADRWPKCDGKAQSPINIQRDEIQREDAASFVFQGYDLPVHGQLSDNGHSLSKLIVIVFSNNNVLQFSKTVQKKKPNTE